MYEQTPIFRDLDGARETVGAGGTLRVLSGGAVSLAAGSTETSAGTEQRQNGSVLEFEAGAIVRLLSGASLIIASGVAKIPEYREVVIPAAEIKTLRLTPVQLVPTPGPGKYLEFLGAQLQLDAGSEVLTVGDGDDLAVRRTGAAGAIVSETIETTGFLDQAADTVKGVKPAASAAAAAGTVEDQPLVLHNAGGAEIAGNASDDSVLHVKVAYFIHDLL